MEYIIHKQNDKTAELIFIDPASGLTHSRSINILDCDTEDKMKERIESHLRAFKHRVTVGVITEASIPSTDVPTDIIIPETISTESKAALEAVIQTKTLELKEIVEKQVADAVKDKKPNPEAEAKLAKIEQALVAKKEVNESF